MTDKNRFGVDTEKCQVFLFSCPGNLPFGFASHPWFVVNRFGVMSRWEVLFRKAKRKMSWGHVHKDFFPPFEGIEVLPFSRTFLWKARLLGKAEGELAERMAEYIEGSPSTYPYCDTYFLTGPNSNTFVQRILNAFPEFSGVLPGNSFGKNYRGASEKAF